jgi:hypothetical protein
MYIILKNTFLGTIEFIFTMVDLSFFDKTMDGLQDAKVDNHYARLEVLTAVVLNNTIFWDITPCSPLKVNRSFGGTYLLHI